MYFVALEESGRAVETTFKLSMAAVIGLAFQGFLIAINPFVGTPHHREPHTKLLSIVVWFLLSAGLWWFCHSATTAQLDAKLTTSQVVILVSWLLCFFPYSWLTGWRLGWYGNLFRYFSPERYNYKISKYQQEHSHDDES
jgi:hypothetical protein